MKLKLVYSIKNMVVRLLNVDAVPSAKSSNRVLDTWCQKNGTNMRLTYWRNDMKSDLNPFEYNRVRIHYNNHKNHAITETYFCINKIIQMEEMEFENFNDEVIS